MNTCCPRPTLFPNLTGPITTDPMPILALLPMMTSPAPLLMVVKSSISVLVPTVN